MSKLEKISQDKLHKNFVKTKTKEIIKITGEKENARRN